MHGQQGQIVPWFDSKEWLQVYNNLYAPTSTLDNKQEALNLLLVWKARCPFMPSGIESTLGLLQVNLQDVQSGTGQDGLYHVLQLAYSSAIMRLVNHLLDSKAAKGATLYQAAKTVGLPDWIIDLRHTAAHSNALASLDHLRDATVICFEWLQKHYWDKHKNCIANFRVKSKTKYKCDDSKIETLANFCLGISICAHPQSKIKTLRDVSQEGMQEIMIEAAQELFGDSVDPRNLPTLSIKSLINFMNTQSKKFLHNEESKCKLIATLLDEELFLSLKIVQDLGSKEFYKSNSLSTHYMRSLEVLLNFVYSNDLMLNFILELIAVTREDNTKHHIRKLAALWIREILRALKKTELFLEKYNWYKSRQTLKKKVDSKTLFQQWFPNEDKRGIILNLLKTIPQELADVDFVTDITSVYNPYLTYFIRDLLTLAYPPESKHIVDMLCNLVNIMSGTEKFTQVGNNKKTYTVEDLKAACRNFDILQNDSVEMTDLDLQGDDCSVIDTVWTVASNPVDWSQCPFGVLPWQQRDSIEDDMMNLD